MRFTLNVLSVGVLAALGANAAPADNAGSAATGFVTPSSDSTMKLRESEPQVIMYADDACGDHLGEFALRAGSRTCVPVSRTGGSIRVPGNCRVTTWSGNNCEGSSFEVPDDHACHSVPCGSVSATC